MPTDSLNLLPQDAITKPLLEWYARKARDLAWRMPTRDVVNGKRPDPYPVWLSEIMLQQTTVATVTTYFEKFLAQWPTLTDLAAAPRDDVLAAWAGLGYYSRARNLHKCARILVADHAGKFPQTAQDLLALPGIGPYTAAAIAAICFDDLAPVIDGNVERVFARLYVLEKPPATIKPRVRDLVSACVPTKLPGQFAQATMDLGATICTPTSPKCSRCPIADPCIAHAQDRATDYPRKLPKKIRPERIGHAYVMVRHDGAVWLQKRGETGLLAGMSEVPGSDWRESDIAYAPPVAGSWLNTGEITHIFTHFRLTLDVHLAQIAVSDMRETSGEWVHPDAFDTAALPTVMRKVLTRALSEIS